MHNEGGPQLELPAQMPQSPETQGGEQAQEQAVEKQRPAKHEAGVGKQAPKPGSTSVQDDIQQLPTIDIQHPALGDEEAAKPPVSPVTNDLRAADADLIEKQWIERSKTVAAKTRDDPHLQKSEMSKIKADYIHKRFNKIIKTDDKK